MMKLIRDIYETKVRDWHIYTNSPVAYYGLVIGSSLALGFFVAYVWIPLVQYIRAIIG